MLCTRSTRLVESLLCQLTKTKVCWQTSRSTPTHNPDSEPTSLCSYSLMLCAQWRSCKYQFYNLWFDGILTRPWLEPTINHIQGEHVNHYTTDAVPKDKNIYYFIQDWTLCHVFCALENIVLHVQYCRNAMHSVITHYNNYC